jgi:hypothetical protein
VLCRQALTLLRREGAVGVRGLRIARRLGRLHRGGQFKHVRLDRGSFS